MSGTSTGVVIIGGGVIGCSIAYHLAKAGTTDVLVLEQFQLTHGATWHAAGVVGQLRPSRNVTRMLQRSVQLYDILEEDSGQAIDWKKVGSLRIASSPNRMKEFRRAATTAKSFGMDMQLLTADEAQSLFPIMDKKGVEGATFIDSDGYVDPASLCQALAAGARKRGVEFIQGRKVTGFKTDGRRITEVDTDQGSIEADTVVNATGMWGHELGKLMGCRVPAFAVEHQYIVTEPIPDMPKGMPTVRDPDLLVYWKPEVRGIAIGGYEPDTLAFARNGIPRDWDRGLLQENFDRFEQIAANAAVRTPVIAEVGVRTAINGAIPISADGDFVMGKVEEYDNVFVSCGFIYGIAAAGGAGSVMAEWIIDGRPSLDLWPLDVRRFHFHDDSRFYMYDRAVEVYAKHYAMKWPVEEFETRRNLRQSPLYERLKGRGAVFGAKAGWERANWFAPEGMEAKDEPSFEFPNWSGPVGEEHKAIRENVALIDQTSFAKMEVAGEGALAALQRLSTANLDRPIGRLAYTQLCNERGGIEADLTVCRMEEDRFYIVTGTAFGGHDFGWIKHHLPDDGSVHTFDTTSAYAVLNLCGPNSRSVLEKIVEEPVDNETFPFSQWRRLTLGAAPVLALRISFTGELGYELHIPTEYAVHAYDLVMEAGESFDIKNVGYRALNSLRMEKGYVVWGGDITPDYTPYHANLDWLISKKTCDQLIASPAFAKLRECGGPDRRLCTFFLDRKAPVYGGEAILRNGKVLGVTSSADVGYTVGKSIVYGYVPSEEAGHSDYEIEVYGEPFKATRAEEPLYDPKNSRMRC